MDPSLATFLAQLQQANQESLNTSLSQMHTQNGQMMQELINLNKNMMDQMQSKPKTPSMVDSRGIGKPGSFKGDEGKFTEWIAKRNAFLRTSTTKAMTWLKKVCMDDKAVNDDVINELSEGHPGVEADTSEFSIKFYSILVACTADDPLG